MQAGDSDSAPANGDDARVSSPASVSGADIDWQPTVGCGLEFDFLDVVVAADGTRT
jgi:hypothetical protein